MIEGEGDALPFASHHTVPRRPAHGGSMHLVRLSRPVPTLALATVLMAALAVVFAACGGAADAPSPAPPTDAPVEMHVRWEIDRAFPATITIHEPPAGQDLYEVRTYEAGEAPEVGTEITDGVLRSDYSEPRRFIALLWNESDEAVRFWVAPHLPLPHIGEQGLMMFCLCTGEVYEVPAGGSWTRVMEFGVTRRAGLEGRPIALTHVVVRGDLVLPTPVAGGGS